MIARSRVQARLLVVVVVVLVTGLTVLGSCAVLLTSGAERAQQSALAATSSADLAVEVELTDLPADAGPDVAAAARVVAAALAPVPPRSSTWVTSTLRDVPPGAGQARRLSWLAGVDDLTARGDLVAGSGRPPPRRGRRGRRSCRWPRPTRWASGSATPCCWRRAPGWTTPARPHR
ncbi:hypothetical protein ACFQX8_09535 [Klenkia terrae]|uniref:hypothetical protein n=1 Tax=Klenkia terrae TaxID=1052259 RepID=UPI00361684ED